LDKYIAKNQQHSNIYCLTPGSWHLRHPGVRIVKMGV